MKIWEPKPPGTLWAKPGMLRDCFTFTYLLIYLITYLLQLSFHSVAIALTLAQAKQIRINLHKRNNTKTQYKQYKTQYIHVHVVYTCTHRIYKYTLLNEPSHLYTTAIFV
jgi:hypothetical protein